MAANCSTSTACRTPHLDMASIFFRHFFFFYILPSSSTKYGNMGRRFNKKNAQTFSIVHRAHDDALYYDNDASGHVLVPLRGGNQRKTAAATQSEQYTQSTKKIFSTSELEKLLNLEEITKIRENEGLAAQFGIYFDDSKYDYMQHLKPIGDGQDGVFIAKDSAKQDKPAKKDIGNLFGDQVPSERKRNVNFDEGQNIPDDLQGFQPDMDPRLREVLEALEDEEYLERRKGEEDREIEGYEDDDDDLFADLLGSGEVEDENEFYYGSDADQYYDDDEYGQEYDEWDLDNYKEEYDAKYDSDDNKRDQKVPVKNDVDVALLYNAGEAPEEAAAEAAKVSFISSNWELDFHKFKSENKKKANDWDSDNEFDEEEEAEDQFDVVGELPALGGTQSLKRGKSKGKLRKKKGAMSDTSEFSMSSSALFRTEGLTLLDDKYEQLAKKFEDDDEEPEYQEFDMALERQDLEGMLDDFLDNYETEKGGRKLVKKSDARHRIQQAADSVSMGKVAAKRKKEQDMAKLGNSFGGMAL